MGKLVTKSFTFDGKRYFCRGKDEAEAIEKMVLKKQALKKGEVVIGENMTVEAWANKAYEIYKTNLADATRKSFEVRMNKILEVIGHLPIRSVRPIQLQELMNTFAGSSSGHITHMKQQIDFIFKAAVKNKIILRNPAEGLTLPQGYTNHRRALTEQEQEISLSVVDQNPRFRIFELMIHCGLRPAEARRVQRSDIKEIDGVPVLSVRGSKSANATRSVPVPDDLYNKIKDVPPFELVVDLPKNNGAVKNAWKALCKAMNIEMGCKVVKGKLVPPYPLADDLVPYCLRHTYCTNLCRAGVDVRVAKTLMGHANIQTTVNIYTHVDDTDILAAADLIKKSQSKSRTKGVKGHEMAI